MLLFSTKKIYVQRKNRPKNSSYDVRWYHKKSKDNIPGYIGKVVPVTPTLLGALILNQHHNLPPKPKKTYHHKYERTLKTQCRRLKAIEYIRYKYKLSMNRIAEVLQVSTRTVWRDIQVLRKLKLHQSFNGKKKWFRRSKIKKGIVNTCKAFLSWKTLKALLSAFIYGTFSTIEIALGDDPP